MMLAGMPTLIDIVSGAGASRPADFTNVNNTVFFRAIDGSNGYELWKSDRYTTPGPSPRSTSCRAGRPLGGG